MRKNRPEADTSYAEFSHLMTGTAGLSDDALELVDLGLGTAESSKLSVMLATIQLPMVVERDILSSLRAYGRACPCCCAATR
jgi:hypothetical protein